ncbi:MAG: efflux RND transporter permease subunit [Kofleriaceae bacterium]
MPTPSAPRRPRGGSTGGPLAWFARNSVAANVIIILLVIGGAMMSCSVKKEVFPEVQMDFVIVNVPYPGASPAEVEEGVTLVVEEQVRAVDAVKTVRSTSMEGFAVVIAELRLGSNAEQALADVKSAVDRITTLPENAERPVIFRPSTRFEVISLMLHGDQPEATLRRYADEVREDLLALPGITAVSLDAVRPLEISIEASQDELRRYGLTLEQIAAIARASSIKLPAGALKTPAGEVLVRTSSQLTTGRQFEDVTVISSPDGARVRLGDIATVTDGFSEDDVRATFDGQPAVMIKVFRVGNQTPNDIAAAVKGYAKTKQLPPGMSLATWFDASELYSQRISLLTRNALMGLVLVLLILGLFLEVKLAFWVTLGIPVSFLGSMLFLPSYGVSINMISLFAYILVLGMVVDDAIVVGEAVYSKRQEGLGLLDAAIFGVKEVAVPVVFAIATTIIFYVPLLLVPGPSGKFFYQIPVVVITVLVISLVESLIVLPAHLAHSRPSTWGPLGVIHRVQQRFSRLVERFIERAYVPFLARALERRYLTVIICFATLVATCGLPAGGHLKFTFMPKIESDIVFMKIEMPFGTAIERTREVEARMITAANAIIAANGGPRIKRGLLSVTGWAGMSGGGPGGRDGGSTGSHLVEAGVYMVPIDQRSITASAFARQWREQMADVPGIDKMTVTYETGGPGGAALAVELTHPNAAQLEAAAAALGQAMAGYAGVHDVNDGVAEGKPQLDLSLEPAGRALGLTEVDLARQVRSAFYGAEVTRFQRKRDEVKVIARLPRDERSSEWNIEQLMVRTPRGGELPLGEAAAIARGSSYTQIERIDGRRTLTVTADVDNAVGNAADVFGKLTTDVLPELMERYPGLRWSPGGTQKDQAEIFASLGRNALLAFLAMLALLAVVFRSYVQPLIVATAIPFGFVGAFLGHLAFGYDLSLMSIMGMVALAGVAVNDSLVFVDAINEFRRDGDEPYAACVRAGGQRFRPILLTSLTTFGGLMPMVFETSLQARFLIPMALSLSFGVLYCTFTTLFSVPALYLIIEDVKRATRWLLGSSPAPTEPPPAPAGERTAS